MKDSIPSPFFQSFSSVTSYDANQTHLIQIAEANNTLNVSGLDPVLNNYERLFKTLPNKTKLHRSDATYVDVIHTHTRNTDRIGEADFFANGGYTQPGCSGPNAGNLSQIPDVIYRISSGSCLAVFMLISKLYMVLYCKLDRLFPIKCNLFLLLLKFLIFLSFPLE